MRDFDRMIKENLSATQRWHRSYDLEARLASYGLDENEGSLSKPSPF